MRRMTIETSAVVGRVLHRCLVFERERSLEHGVATYARLARAAESVLLLRLIRAHVTVHALHDTVFDRMMR